MPEPVASPPPFYGLNRQRPEPAPFIGPVERTLQQAVRRGLRIWKAQAENELEYRRLHGPPTILVSPGELAEMKRLGWVK